MRYTVITVALNPGAMLHQTCDSILSQTHGEWEWLIKDGGSTDGSLEKLPQDPRIRVISAPDRGIYDAMNQAVLQASGDYVHFLNAGDLFYSSVVLAKFREIITGSGFPDMVCGSIFNQRTKTFNQLPAILSRRYLFRKSVCQQAIFYRSAILRARPAFSQNYRIYADHEFFMRMMRDAKPTILRTDEVVVAYDGGGVSTSAKQADMRWQEITNIRHQYFTATERLRWGLIVTLLCTRQRIWLLARLRGGWLERAYHSLAAALNRYFVCLW